MKIETRDSQGKINGYLIPIWNVLDGPQVDQVYLTVIGQGMMKGPHLHKKRRGLFKCIKGVTVIVWRDEGGKYHRSSMGIAVDTIEILPGIPAALYNQGMGEAYVLNMPSPPWRPDEPDEWPVENWDLPFVIGPAKGE